jgi:multidrug efflux pump subunit AcrA (membrane-fusion protein)
MRFLELLMLLCLAGCQAAVDGAAAFGTPEAGESRVARGTVERLVVVDGGLYSPSSRPITIQRIRWYWDYNISWAAEEGSIVKEGDVVIKLDQSAIQKDLTERENNLEEAKLTLEEENIRADDEIAEAKASVTAAEFDIKKEKLLLTDSDAVSEAEKQKQRLKVAGAEASLRRAKEKVVATRERVERRLEMQRLKVKQAEEDVAEMKAGLDKTELKAPQDGLLIFPLYSTNAGWQKARPGGAVGVNAQVAEIANPKDLVARLFVPEIDADGIIAGTPGEVMLSIAPGKAFTGKVKSVASVPTTAAERDGSKSSKPADNVRQFEILFEVDGLPAEAMPGMTVRAVLAPVKKAGVLLAPTEALAAAAPAGASPPKPAIDPAGGAPDVAYVLARGKDETAFGWRRIKLGVQSLTHAEVSEGLAEGDTVKVFAW